MITSGWLGGYHPVRELLRSRPAEVVRVLLAEGRGGGRRGDIERSCRAHGIPYESRPRAQLDQLVAGAHNGVVAEVRGPGGRPPGGDPDLVVLLEDIQDPRNLGAILRVCEGTGVGRVLLRDRGSAPLTPVVAKTAAGATEWLAVERVVNSAQEIERLRAEGFWIYGAVVGGRPPWEIDWSGRAALCLGGEGGGLRARTRRLCDELVGLPMRGRVESLNVATAAAALLFEAVRQRCALPAPAE